MDAEELKKRTKQFAIDVGKLTIQLERSDLNRNYSNQIIRASSSVAANYRAVRRAKSKADFINKLKIVEEELDESLLFLELLYEFNPVHKVIISNIFRDGEELLKIIVATLNTSRAT
jgi:four helix bundle protein